MDNEWDISLAIVSDLHCHEQTYSPQESWLIAGASRKPAGNHPVQALISLITSGPIRADVVVCPGDLANRVSSVGMMQSWDHLNELKRELKAKLLLTTLGNHDVDCKRLHNGDPFHIPRSIHGSFPAPSESDLASFWSNGFYIANGPSKSEFLVLNTVISHTDEATAKRGTFDHERIEELDRILTERARKRNASARTPHRIVIMHHHPLLHSSSRFSSADVLAFGDQLLEVLNRHEFRLIIHGHRHEPRIHRLAAGLSEQFVLAAGSFSAILTEMGTWTRNLFHILKLRREPTDGRVIGELLTWEYNKGLGWRESTSVSAALPHVARFCSPRPNLSIDAIEHACRIAVGSILRSHQLNEMFPALGLLLPSEIQSVRDELSQRGIKLVLAENGTLDYLGAP